MKGRAGHGRDKRNKLLYLSTKSPEEKQGVEIHTQYDLNPDDKNKKQKTNKQKTNKQKKHPTTKPK